MCPEPFCDNESNARSYSRSFPAVFDRSMGSEIWDCSGKRYLDFLAGCGSLNYGHNHPVLKQSLLRYIERDGIAHSLDLHSQSKADFLECFREHILKPRNLDYVVQFTGPTGANAVEAALKLARKVTGRSNVVSFTNGFHGVTLGALATTGNSYNRGAAGVPLGGVVRMPYEGYCGDGFDSLDLFERMLRDPSSGLECPAAVIVETIQGEGGLNCASAEWLQNLHSLCRQNNILVILDDVQAGCGRTGSFFSFEFAGIQPDIVTLAKSISGFGLPMALVLIRRAIDVWQPAEHNGTFRGNNHAFVTATAMIKYYWQNGDFAAEVQRKGDSLHKRLREIAWQFPKEILGVRGRGMMRGLLFADPAKAADVTAAAYRRGLVIERSGSHDEVVKCMPPLVIDDNLLGKGVDILQQATQEVLLPHMGLHSPSPTTRGPHWFGSSTSSSSQ